ncbi:hypothetical protein OIU85_010161 [Salix viminalis]|uniref:Uncharacterized protein n=2 Tax=Salix TaxID=40685 RepID=A0A9Q0SGW2_SALVM|nr:hypothetical protein OIU84_008057 [Salix udensis]KAJ6676952.1 hypothetical protein OIU85_010161 [Salix viminalis]
MELFLKLGTLENPLNGPLGNPSARQATNENSSNRMDMKMLANQHRDKTMLWVPKRRIEALHIAYNKPPIMHGARCRSDLTSTSSTAGQYTNTCSLHSIIVCQLAPRLIKRVKAPLKGRPYTLYKAFLLDYAQLAPLHYTG